MCVSLKGLQPASLGHQLGGELRDQLVHSDTEILLTAEAFRGHDYAARLADISAPSLRHVVVDNRITDSADAAC